MSSSGVTEFQDFLYVSFFCMEEAYEMFREFIRSKKTRDLGLPLVFYIFWHFVIHIVLEKKRKISIRCGETFPKYYPAGIYGQKNVEIFYKFSLALESERILSAFYRQTGTGTLHMYGEK